MSDFVEPIVLIDSTDLVKPRSAAPTRRLFQPAGGGNWSSWKAVTFQLLILAVEGGPTSFQLQPRFMFGIPHTTGNIYRQPYWYYPDAATLTSRIVEGTNLPAITEATSLPYVQERTVREPLRKLIGIDLGEPGGPNPFVMTGGTNPGLRLVLTASPGVV